MFCSNCGTKNEDGAKFCVNCGTTFEETSESTAVETAPVYSQEVEDYAADSGEKKAKIKKIVTIAVIVAVVAAIAFFAVKLIGGLFGDKDEIDYSNHPLIYVKDGDVMVTPVNKKAGYELGETDELGTLQVTEDGKGIFYGADFEGGEYDLYYRKANNMKGEGQKIDSGVTSFEIVPGTKNVIYLKDDKLIYHDLKKETKIDSNVTDIESVTEDGKYVFYIDDENTTYISNIGKKAKPEEIGENVYIVSDYYEEYAPIYFIKEEKLYKKELGKKEEKLANDVYSAFILEGKVFVVQADEKEYKFDDLFINDMKDEIENLVDPSTLEAPDYDDYADYDDYSAAYEAYWEEYDEAWDKWYEYGDYAELEEHYNEYPQTISTYTLYEVKGNDLKKIDENITRMGWGSETAKAYFKNADGGFDKIKFSELDTSWGVFSDASNKISERLYSNGGDSSLYLVTSSAKSFLAIEDAKDIKDYDFSEDGKLFYALEKKEGKDEGELKSYKIGSSKLSGEKVVSDDVSDYDIYENGEIVIENKDGETSLVIGKKTVDLGDDIRSLRYDDGVFYFLADYSDKSSDGDLSYCGKNGKVKKIADDVNQYRVFSEKRIAYIGDYDDDDRCGTLYIGGKSGKAKVIDEEVESIIW